MDGFLAQTPKMRRAQLRAAVRRRVSRLVSGTVSWVSVEFNRVEIPRDHEQLVDFLCNDEWPFHGQRQLTPADIDAIDFSSPDVASFWIVDTSQTVGLVRLLDLGDIGSGAPLFDLRIAGRHRGCGFGTRATRWIVDHLFTSYPELHRIEANTRGDNAAMQRVLSGAGFTHEGRLRLAWRSEEGHWFDTMIYGMLRTDWTSADNGQGAPKPSRSLPPRDRG